MSDPKRWTEDEMIELAARGAGKVEFRGHLGTSLVTYDEIEAMAAVLILLGVHPIRPHAPSPDRSPFSPIKARV